MVVAMERCAAEGLRTGFIDANANILPEFFARARSTAFYINFCDPWPTKRHAKRRPTHGNFLKFLSPGARATAGRSISRRTTPPLFAWSVEEIPQFGFTFPRSRTTNANGAVGV